MNSSVTIDRVRGLAHYLPVLEWGKSYTGATLTSDLVAAMIVTIMLIPQSLAYALLARLPAQMGLYASILPLLAYALFGTSRALAVWSGRTDFLTTLTGRVFCRSLMRCKR